MATSDNPRSRGPQDQPPTDPATERFANPAGDTAMFAAGASFDPTTRPAGPRRRNESTAPPLIPPPPAASGGQYRPPGAAGYAPPQPRGPRVSPPQPWPPPPPDPHGARQPSPPPPPRSAEQPRPSAAAARAANDAAMSFMARLLLRGMRGELIRQDWFQNVRRQNADKFVLGTFGAAVIIVLALQFGIEPGGWGSLIAAVVLKYPVWIALGFIYVAVGTKLSHQFLLWGVCLGGALVAVWSVFSTLRAMRAAHAVNSMLGVQVIPTGYLIFMLIVHAVMAVVFGYLGVLVYRAINRPVS